MFTFFKIGAKTKTTTSDRVRTSIQDGCARTIATVYDTQLHTPLMVCTVAYALMRLGSNESTIYAIHNRIHDRDRAQYLTICILTLTNGALPAQSQENLVTKFTTVIKWNRLR